MQVFIVLSACLVASSALSVGVRSSIFDCPTVNVVEDFDLESFAGVWYQQYYSLGSEMSQGFSYCGVGTWTQLNKTTIHMVNKQKGILGVWETIEGDAVLENTSVGNFTTTFSTLFGDKTYQLKVLATDYVNYAITYSCAKVLGIPLEAAWITTRFQNPTGDELTNLEELVQTAIDNINGLHDSDFHYTEQKDC